MMKKTISNEVKRGLIYGKAPYIRGGNLYFDSIQVSKDNLVIRHKGKDMATFEPVHPVNFEGGETLTFFLEEGHMKIRLT